MHRHPRLSAVLLPALATVALFTTAAAQTSNALQPRAAACSSDNAAPSAHVTLQIADAQGLAIPRAAVEARCGNSVHNGISADDGHVTLDLHPGSYQVTARAPGFATITQTVDPTAGAITITLPIAASSDTVNVTADTGFVPYESNAGSKTNSLLIEVPQSISIVNQREMEARQVITMNEALRYTPGIQADEYGTEIRYDWLKIRGFDAQTFGVFRDGMRFNSLAGKLDPYELESVEVLKGPSSILYGEVPPGGLINQVTKRPGAERSTTVEAQFGSYSRRQGALDTTGSFDRNQHFRYRLLGLVRNSGTQTNYVPDNRRLIAPSFTWHPSDRTNVTVLTDWQHDGTKWSQFLPASGTLYNTNPNGIIRSAPLPASPALTSSRAIRHPPATPATTSSRTAGTSTPTTASSTSTFTARRSTARASTATAPRSCRATSSPRPASTTTTLPTTAPCAASPPAIGNRPSCSATTTSTSTSTCTTPSTRLAPRATSTSFSPSTAATRLPPRCRCRTSTRTTSCSSTACMRRTRSSSATTSSSRWAAARISRRTTSPTSSRRAATSRTSTSDSPAAPASPTFPDSGIAPYFAYSTSFLPNAGTLLTTITNGTASSTPAKPSDSRQVEGGVKIQPRTSNSFITASVFQINQTNVIVSDANFQSRQSGEVRSRGFELEGVASLSHGWNLHAGYTLTATNVLKNLPGGSSNPTAASYDPGIGSWLGQTPRNQVSALADYTQRAGRFAGFGGNFGVRFVGKNLTNPPTSVNDPGSFYVPNYTLLDAGLRFGFRHTLFSVNATNLTDKRYVATCGGLAYCYYGYARNVIGSAKYHF